jgi:signal transduction histidine kinase
LSGALGGRLRCQEPIKPIKAIGDSDRLIQCLTNLIENAAKYSPPTAPIELGLTYSADQVTFHVRDHGPGVPLEERQQIFERFVRGRDALAGPHAGSGIGLAVVKSLMTAMGGDVVVTEASGGGADFQLWVSRQNQDDGYPASKKSNQDSVNNRKRPQLPWFVNSGPARAIRSRGKS